MYAFCCNTLWGLWLYFIYRFRLHYNVNIKSVEVGGDVLQLPTDVFDTGSGQGAIIDSGTTLAYLPDAVYKELISAVRGVPISSCDFSTFNLDLAWAFGPSD